MIKDMSFAEQSALFAKLSNQAYKEFGTVEKLYKKLGFTTTAYFANDGSNVYVTQNETDIVVVCRGTEVKEWNDISADLSIALYPARIGDGKVHRGFRTYSDRVWDLVANEITNSPDKTLWLTGHSLGAAMATLMARRCLLQEHLPNPEALFTYGSPRTGNRKYVNQFNENIIHHRWINDGDIVTKIPLPIRFHHCGVMHHIDSKGNITVDYKHKLSLTRLLNLFSLKGILKLLMGDVKDHSSELYFKHLDYWAENEI